MKNILRVFVLYALVASGVGVVIAAENPDFTTNPANTFSNVGKDQKYATTVLESTDFTQVGWIFVVKSFEYANFYLDSIGSNVSMDGASLYEKTKGTFKYGVFQSLYSLKGVAVSEAFISKSPLFSNLDAGSYEVVFNVAGYGVTGDKPKTYKFTGHITTVPEPESYAMLLAGLGLMGTIARRRSKKSQ